ncbi:MAG: membrane dipeptidase [Pseudomonadota bacterium]
MWKWIAGAIIVLIVGAVVTLDIIVKDFDERNNAVQSVTKYEVSDEAHALHDGLIVADLHADTFLWNRDPAERQSRGHVDFVRLKEGGVGLQVFAAVTKSPRGQNYEKNAADSDQLTLLVKAQRWPARTWDSLLERALYQGGRMASASSELDEFSLIRTRIDLQAALESDHLAGVFAIEGGHALEGDVDNLNVLYEAGLRVMGLHHFFDNALGGSLHGLSGSGLSTFGREAVARAEGLGVIIDVAHSSEASVRDVLAMATRPVIISHTGLQGHCDSTRNISDELMVQIAEAGGLIGIGFWDAAICDISPNSVASAILYAVELVGANHVALGSDFDGTVATAFDASQLAVITQALIDNGADEEVIRKVMGENAIQFFLTYLPIDDSS